MNNSFFIYLQQLELMAFFSGYPLVYAVTIFIAGNKPLKNNFKSRMVSLLPFAYALVGTLYLGLQLKNLYPNYSFDNIKHTIQLPWLIGWGLLSMLFWIPALSKKIFVSLLHSLIFLFFLLRDLFLQLTASATDVSMLQNDMKIYSISLLINILALAIIVFLYFLFTRYNKSKKAQSGN